MQKVLLGMSGGVDSSVSAVLLKEAGYEVIGTTLSLCPNGSCCNLNTYLDAKTVCKKLGIEHFIMEATDEFKQYVIDDFVNSYQNGLTPSPCIECNKYLKFGTMYKQAKKMGIDYIATGHYAKMEYSEKYGKTVLKKSNNLAKDQTYFLYTMPKEIMGEVLFPLADFTTKQEIREIAKANGMKVASKPDSEDICFVPDGDYKSFLKMNLAKNAVKSGNIVLANGTILGKHEGLIHYTVGQRKGLGISYREPLYVIGLNKGKNEVVVGTEKELYGKELIAKELNFLLDMDLSKPIQVKAKIRYRAPEAKATLHVIEENGEQIAKVVFNEPQRAITPGQSVVFYLDDVVLGGGKICPIEGVR